MDPFASALSAARAVREKKVSPVELVEECLRRIDRVNPALNAVTWRRDEALRSEAKRAEAAVMNGSARGPFFGVPIAIKDLTFVEGWPMTFGSRAAEHNVTSFTAAIVEHLIRAGFLLACRTNTPEFGILPAAENALWGASRNPWDVSRTPGGSSGGSAAVVAAGAVAVAHANDGGGSIRIPASCCGLVGLKPSRGRVSSGPLVCDVMHGGAVEGCVTRTVADTAAVLDAISEFDPHARYNAPLPQRPFSAEVGAAAGRLRIAYTTAAPTGVPVARECVKAVERTAAVLAELGHEVFEGAPDWPDQNDVLPMFLTVWNTGAGYWDVADWSLVEPLTAAMRAQAQAVDSLTYVRALAMLQIHSRRVVASWKRDFDILITPTLAVEPWQVGCLFEDAAGDPMIPLYRAAEFCPFTPLINTTGQPAISLPVHWSAEGLPVGVQLVGAPWGEAELIRVAAQLEEAVPWAQRRPPVSANHAAS
jgi:amidase